MAGSWKRRLAAAAATAIALMAFAGTADAAIYWPNFGAVSRVNNDGTVPAEEFIARPSGEGPMSQIGCAGIAVTATRIFWALPATGSIAEANLDGSQPNFQFITGLRNPCGVAVDSSSIYWTEFEGGAIGRANLAGAEVDRGFVTELKRPCGVAVGGDWIYWTAEALEGGESFLARRPLAGGVPERVFGDFSTVLCGVALDPEHVYWGGFGETIGRAKLDGSEPEPSFIAGLDRPIGVALYGPDIYWAQNDVLARKIEATEIVGTHRATFSFELPAGVPQGIAVDSVVVPPPVPTPLPNEVTFGKPRHVRHRPVTYLPLVFPQGGNFSLAVPRSIHWQVAASGSRPHALAAAGSRLVKVTPAGGKAAVSLRRRLAATGKAWVPIQVRFAAADGSRTTSHERVSLVAPTAPSGGRAKAGASSASASASPVRP